MTQAELSSAESPLGPTLDFLAVLWDLNHALEATSSRMQSELGVTAQQRMILRIIGKCPGLLAGQLAARLKVHPGTLSTALARLEKRRLIVRERDARDKRRIVLSLTAAGRRLDVPTPRTVESATSRVLARITSRDRAATLRCLRAITDELSTGESRRARA